MEAKKKNRQHVLALSSAAGMRQHKIVSALVSSALPFARTGLNHLTARISAMPGLVFQTLLKARESPAGTAIVSVPAVRMLCAIGKGFVDVQSKDGRKLMVKSAQRQRKELYQTLNVLFERVLAFYGKGLHAIKTNAIIRSSHQQVVSVMRRCAQARNDLAEKHSAVVPAFNGIALAALFYMIYRVGIYSKAENLSKNMKIVAGVDRVNKGDIVLSLRNEHRFARLGRYWLQTVNYVAESFCFDAVAAEPTVDVIKVRSWLREPLAAEVSRLGEFFNQAQDKFLHKQVTIRISGVVRGAKQQKVIEPTLLNCEMFYRPGWWNKKIDVTREILNIARQECTMEIEKMVSFRFAPPKFCLLAVPMHKQRRDNATRREGDATEGHGCRVLATSTAGEGGKNPCAWTDTLIALGALVYFGAVRALSIDEEDA